MAWPNIVLPALGKLKDWYTQLNTYFANCKSLWDAHIAGIADKHDANDITYTGNVSGAANVKEGLDALHDRVDAIITTPAEGVSAQEIIDARKGKATLGAKIDEIDAHMADLANMIGSDYPASPKANKVFYKIV